MATGPAYMNTTPHHSKVRVSLTLSSPLFVAGQDVTGKMEMECRADSGVGIGLIMVELLAIQELNSRDHSASSTFLHTRRLFQGSGLPPSNAVSVHPIPGAAPLPEDYFPARRGMTTFFFRFPIPLSSPSSVSFASGLAKIRYEVRANVGVAHRGEKRVVTDNVEADVVQCEDMDGTAAEHVIVGENGKMYVHGRIIGGRIISSQRACLELRVKNQSSKKTSGLSLILTRTLVLHNAATNSRAPLQLSDTLFSQTFRGVEYSVQAGAEGVANLVFDVPKAARVVKGGIRHGADDDEGGRRRTGALFEIRCILSVKIGMGIGSKDVAFEMPVQLSHPAALPEPSPTMEPYVSPAADAYASSQDGLHHNPLPRAMSPVFETRSPHYGQSPGPGTMSATTSYPYASPSLPSSSTSPPMQYYQTAFPIPPHPHASHQQLWSPPPPAMSPLPYFPDKHQAYYFPNPLMGLIPFAYPARPSSAGAGPLRNASPVGLSGVDAVNSVYPTFQQRRQQLQAQARSTSHQNPPVESTVKDEGAEEGKGERASRISHHLRMSSRARSMSPTSHRFPVTPLELPAAVATLHVTNLRHRECPPVLSPRPISSPRNSFSPDVPGINGVSNIQGTARSDRVDLLERLVDPAPGEEGKSVEEVLKDLERVENEMEKTLPKPPVPTGKPLVSKRLLGVPKASEVFGEHSVADGAKGMGQDERAKSVLRPSPVARRISIDGKGREKGRGRNNEEDMGADLLKQKLDQPSTGLDVLEKRLLVEVGTRKPQTPNRPTVFQVGLLTDLPTTSRSPDTPLHPEGGDSEISSLALASNSSAEPYSKKAGSTSTSTLVLRSATSHKFGEKVSSRQALPDIKEHSTARPNDRPKGEKAKEHEVIKLRKAAKSRVADWLAVQSRSDAVEVAASGPSIRSVEGVTATGDKSQDLPPQNDKPSPNRVFLQSQPVELPSISEKIESKPSQHPVKPDLRHDALLPKTKSPAVPPKPPPLSSPRLRKPLPLVDEAQSVSNAHDLTPRLDPRLDPRKLRVPQLSSPVVPETKYDVRSARGGKGGITTSVVALWASLAEDASKDAQTARPMKPVTKPITRNPATRPAFLDVGKAKASPAIAGPSPKTPNDAASPPPSPPAPPSQAENAMKSASVPAAVVPSHAKPHLSSTASLACPTPTPLLRAKPSPLSPTIVDSRLGESSGSTRPVVARDMAFGQARLKDLIKKYQQAAS